VGLKLADFVVVIEGDEEARMELIKRLDSW
jgi:hypothetical protein